MTFWNFQRANRRRCLAALSLLFGFFFLVWWGLFEIVRLFFPFPFSLPYLFFVVGAFFPILFLLRRSEGAIREFIDAIGALPLDKEDLRHRRVENIVREISLSAGVTPPQVYIFPSPLKNAFSIKTEEGGTLVLSEGLAGNLRRDEIQGVVAHEIGHLVEGDTEYKTFLATLSAGFLSTRRLLGFSSSSQEGTEKGIGLPLQGGRFGLFAITVVLYLLVASLVARLLSLLVSRQREYLADLKALELTRNPEALARALCVVGRDRLRALVPLTHPSFAMLFFVNPAWRDWEEGSGLQAELFSTHPPLSERIRRLLRIAGVPVGLFYTQTMRHRAEIPPEDELYTKGREGWAGPFPLSQAMAQALGEPGSTLFSPEAGEIAPLSLGEATPHGCPRCGVSLTRAYFEDVPLLLCSGCGGAVMEGVRFKRTLIRESPVAESVRKTAGEVKEGFLKRKKETGKTRVGEFDPSPLLSCPLCGKPMGRFFYSYNLPVVLDCCGSCGIYFFDRNEWLLLQ